MTADLYCSRADVAKRVPLGSFTSPGGIVASSLSDTNIITCDGHGLETNDPVTVRAIEGGALPDPLIESVTYYAIRLTNASFRLAAAPNGAQIDLTTDGISVVITREPDFYETIEFVSRWADGLLPAHLVPLQAPIHPLVRGVVADVAAKRVMNADGKSSAVVDAAELAGKAILERYATGLPLRGAAATAKANKAVTSSFSTNGSDPRGWAPCGSGHLP